MILWWDAGTHVACEESKGVEVTAASFIVRAARLLIAKLGPFQDSAGASEVTLAVSGVKGQCGDQSVGGSADLAERD